MFPVDYVYRPGVFVARGDKAEERLRKVFTETTDPILIRGPSGIGKSSILVWLLRELGLRAYKPTENDLRHHDWIISRGTVVVLDDIHLFRDRQCEIDITRLVERNRPRVMALVPDESYPNDWYLLKLFKQQVAVEPWSEPEGRKLAEAYGQSFSKDDFGYTALSVVAPRSYMLRLYERGYGTNGRAVLDALKVLKSLTASYLPRKVVALYAERFCMRDAKPGDGEPALRAVEDKWCRTRGNSVLLRDGFEPAINASFSWDSDAWKHLMTVLLDGPCGDSHDAAASLAWRLSLNGKHDAALSVAGHCLSTGCSNPRVFLAEGRSLRRLGRSDASEKPLLEALQRFERAEDKRGVWDAATELVHLYLEEERFDLSKFLHHLVKLYDCFIDRGQLLDVIDNAVAVVSAVESAADPAQLANLRASAAELVEMRKLIVDSYMMAESLERDGAKAVKSGDHTKARGSYVKSLDAYRELNRFKDVKRIALLLGALAEQDGDNRTALKHYLTALAAVDRANLTTQDTVAPRIAAMRERLGDVAFEKLNDEVARELAAEAGARADKQD